jgi:hypothetical protein
MLTNRKRNDEQAHILRTGRDRYSRIGIGVRAAVLFPALQTVLTREGVSLGDLGIFVLLSYAAGHLIAAIGNLGESLFWGVLGGMPTDWITKTSTTLLSSSQIDLLEKKLQARLGMTERIRGLDLTVWKPISRQIYADVAKNGKPERIETFNGMYGLNRGLAAATFALACVGAVQGKWPIALALLALAAVYNYRAYRFGVYYGRELYLQFLVLDDAKTVPPGKHEQES